MIWMFDTEVLFEVLLKNSSYAIMIQKKWVIRFNNQHWRVEVNFVNAKQQIVF